MAETSYSLDSFILKFVTPLTLIAIVWVGNSLITLDKNMAVVKKDIQFISKILDGELDNIKNRLIIVEAKLENSDSTIILYKIELLEKSIKEIQDK